MGFEYLDGKNWVNISREERLYCAHLYFQMRGKELKFVQWLNENHRIELPTDCEWEIGYEVCFYRDFFKYFREDSIKDNIAYPQKRTFDLCLFSESNIVIIEAKVQQGFGIEQSQEFRKDKSLISSLLNTKIKVDTVLLASSQFYKNYTKFSNKTTLEGFDFRISWMDLYQLCSNKLFLKADKLYKN